MDSWRALRRPASKVAPGLIPKKAKNPGNYARKERYVISVDLYMLTILTSV
jgi:hypothetical protein